MVDSKEAWTNLHKESRYRPKYPSEPVVQFVFRNFRRDGKEKVLDLGCGAGRHIFFMGSEKIQPYGLDFSSEGVNYTKKMLDNLDMQEYVDNIKVGSMTEIPFKDNMFDGIVSYGSLCYLSMTDIKKTISEMKRVLRPGGKIFCVTRSIEDYRCSKGNCIETKEKNTYYVDVDNTKLCANSENGMLMHFLDKQEIEELFSDFKCLEINKMVETHSNGEIADSSYIVTCERG